MTKHDSDDSFPGSEGTDSLRYPDFDPFGDTGQEERSGSIRPERSGKIRPRGSNSSEEIEEDDSEEWAGMVGFTDVVEVADPGYVTRDGAVMGDSFASTTPGAPAQRIGKLRPRAARPILPQGRYVFKFRTLKLGFSGLRSPFKTLRRPKIPPRM